MKTYPACKELEKAHFKSGRCQKSFNLELDTALILTLKTPIMTNCTVHFCDQCIA